MNAFRMLGTALLITLSGCSGNPQAPSWMSESPEQYPQRDYLSAVGEGPSRAAAEQRALASLARIFEVKIDEQHSDYSMFSRGSDLPSTAVNRQLSARQLIAATEQLIEGATPVDYWHHQQRHLVLVVLERAGAAQRLRQKMTLLDQQTAGLLRYADGVRSPLVRIAALEQSRQLQLQRQPLNRNLSVVSGQSMPPLSPVAALEQQIRAAITGLRFRVDQADPLRSMLEQTVARMGASIADQGVLLSASLDRQPVTYRQGWYWITASLELRIADQDGQILAQQRWPLKVSAQQQGEVEKRLLDQLNGSFTQRFYQLLSSTEGVQPR